ncbi:MAG: TetR/AcrR family transcriptional regulator C-terminal domain-containing protein, partial [Actinomycetota bacterium]|nr:TetR/AcrR family transcriptional regulator C-terminal domain-containing protein [Actinomycetota bacterium]
LYEAVLSEFSPLFRRAADPAELVERPPEEVLPLLASGYLDTFDDPAVVRLLRISISEAAFDPETGNQFLEVAKTRVLKFLVAYLGRQVELGRLKPHDPQSSARSFMGMLVIYVLNREVLTGLKKSLPDKEQYAKDVVGIFLDGLRA